MNEYNHSDELQHYGVLGMKWGVRKARKSGSSYQYKSHSTKKWEKRADANKKIADDYERNSLSRTASLYREKSSRASKIAARSREHDNKMFEFSKKTKIGSVIATNVLLGPWGNKTYNSVIASGGTKGAAVATTVLSGILGLTPITAAIAKSSYIRNIE